MSKFSWDVLIGVCIGCIHGLDGYDLCGSSMGGCIGFFSVYVYSLEVVLVNSCVCWVGWLAVACGYNWLLCQRFNNMGVDSSLLLVCGLGKLFFTKVCVFVALCVYVGNGGCYVGCGCVRPLCGGS